MTSGSAVAPNPGSTHIQGLDALRGIAVLLVVLAHVTTKTLGGGVGVTIFFVLSGYLITSILLKEHEKYGSINLRFFYARRAVRLVPALLAVLAVTPLLMLVVGDPRLGEYPKWMTVTGLYVMDYARALGFPETPFGHTWSLAVEEQFYLFWPLALLFFMAKARGNALKLSRIVMVTFAVFLVWRIVAGVILPMEWSDYSLDTRAYALLIGCLLATRQAAGQKIPAGRAAFFLSLIGLAAVTCSTLIVDSSFIRDNYTILATLLSFVVVASVSSAPKMLTMKPLLWFGKVSYGVYLWHFVLLKLEFAGQEPDSMIFRIGLALASIALAWASWHLVEAPCNKLRHRFQRASSPAAGKSPTAEPETSTV